jgi:hypothetical protein
VFNDTLPMIELVNASTPVFAFTEPASARARRTGATALVNISAPTSASVAFSALM